MQKLKWTWIAFSLFFASCLFESKPDDIIKPGVLSLSLHLKANSNALLKTSSADTIFALDTLKIILRTAGNSDSTLTYTISGRSDSGNINVTPKIYTLSSLRTWKAFIIAIDTTLNPSRKDTVYNDSVSFFVNPGDTTFVTKTANPLYSILRARYVSNSPASITNNVKWCRLRVDGTARDSILVGPHLYGIGYGNGNTGCLVGDSGIIYRTTNSGVNWTLATSSTTQSLNGVYFTSTNTGYAVGNGGTVIKTTTGISWSAQTSGVTQNLNGVFFPSSSVGYAVGNAGTIRKSNATTWSAITSGTTNNLYGIYSTSTSISYAVGASGTIITTVNGGTNWSTQTSNSTRNLFAVFFPVTATGFVVGDSGTILKTTNSGTNWSVLASGLTKKLSGVYFSDANTGWVVGDDGTMLTTNNGGTNWNVMATGTHQKFNFIGFTTNKSAATAVGDVGAFLTSTNLTSWTFGLIGTKSFDLLLTYKYLTPNIPHTLIIDAMDSLSATLRGYQATKSITLSPGKDTTISPNSSLTKCGYGAPACTP